MIVASTIVPLPTNSPRSERWALISANSRSVSWCFSSSRRKFRIEVSSGITSSSVLHPRKPAHRDRVVERFLGPGVRQVVPLLQAVDAKHPLQRQRRATALPGCPSDNAARSARKAAARAPPVPSRPETPRGASSCPCRSSPSNVISDRCRQGTSCDRAKELRVEFIEISARYVTADQTEPEGQWRNARKSAAHLDCSLVAAVIARRYVSAHC